ncbi:Alpha/Beta hydrolase protein [Xylariales sp. PMI_506]|nr:Alpha/Beta hydrolase protein [Xylariales sp. PMI_506]
MRASTWTALQGFALTALAGPVPQDLHLYLAPRDSVTTAQVDSLAFYAQYAGAAYCNSDVAVGTVISCSDGTCPDVTAAGATVSATFLGTDTDAEGFVAVDKTNDLIVVSFKGSHSIRNWITDILFLQESCDLVSGCEVHSGFYEAWQEIATQVEKALAAAVAANPTYPIIFTGHSLGAAIATLGVAYVRNLGYSIDLYTYGSPRVGNLNFVEYVTNQAGAENRVTHYDDPVPRLPPILFNYRHTSPEYWLADGSATTEDYTATDIEVCDGYANVDCNAGTTGLDTNAHNYYFVVIDGCDPEGLEFKARRSTAGNETDAELAVTLTNYVEQDIAYVQTNLSGNVWS